ncbi:MAG: S41 family peptidase [Saprospiraceae bacterium]
MAKVVILAVLSLSSLSLLGQSEPLSTRDSIHTFYDQLFETLEENFLYSKSVNWEEIKPFIKNEALQKDSLQAALSLCPTLFDTIKGDHLMVFAGENYYQSNLKKQLSKEQFSENFLSIYTEENPFEVKVIDEQYGYIFIPGMLLLNATRPELDSVSQEIYDAVIQIDTTQNIKGWIIDLRLNIGGNSNVMLAGLYHLLGDNTVNLGLNADQHLKYRSGLYQGALHENHQVLTKVQNVITPKTEVPVALITGVMTASAGEFVALGFRGRKNVQIIGEESYGFLTANDLFELPFDITAAITLSYGTDRTMNYTKTIIPDVPISKKDNFTDLMKDENVKAAMEFIDNCGSSYDNFAFNYNDIKYNGFIELPNQKARGMIVLIPGHGPTDFGEGADYSELRHFFKENGFAVCFWDKAGCGQSEGIYDHNQSIESSAKEAMAAIAKIKNLNIPGSNQIGLWGISRAGWICPLIIEQDASIAFWISVSGTDQFENSRYMLEANLRAENRSKSEINLLMREWDHYQKVLVRGGESLEDFLNAIPNLMKDPYFNANNFQFTEEVFKAVQDAYQNNGTNYDDSTNLAIMVNDFEHKLSRIDIPVLAIFGEKDTQIDWKKTQSFYEKTIGNNSKADLTIKTFPNGNHTIQKCESGGINENLEKFGYATCDSYYDVMLMWLNKLY